MGRRYESPEERKFKELLSYSKDDIRERFECKDDTICYAFHERWADGFVTVKKKRDGFPVVNAFFKGFDKSVGSHDYPVLESVGRHFVDAFGDVDGVNASIDW